MDFPSKFDQIRKKLWIWSHLLEKSSMENFIFCAVKQEVITEWIISRHVGIQYFDPSEDSLLSTDA